MKGRPPKSVELKRMQGTLEPGREPESPLSMEPLSAAPVVPDDFSDDERDFWNYVTVSLFNAGRLRAVDLLNIKMAAFWWGVFCKSRLVVDKTGVEYKTDTGYDRITPGLAAAEKASKMLKDFGDRYGLNLLYADRIKGGDKPKDDELSEMMK